LRSFGWAGRVRGLLISVVVGLVGGGCSTSTQSVSALGGGCESCHTHVTPAHTHAVIGCTDCHGGNAPSATDTAVLAFAPYGSMQYQAVVDASHVHPKAGNEAFFLAAGLTGARGACFNGAVDPDCNGGDANGLGSVDDAVDSELARDLNYARFINPGDLRVAHASCGGGAPGAGNYGGCHVEEVQRVRRSMMATNASVVTAAFIGNRGRSDARGYVFDLDGPQGADGCFRTSDNKYDSACLVGHRAFAGDDLGAGDAENAPGRFEAFPGRVAALSSSTSTLAHGGHAPRLAGVGGHALDGTSQPQDHMDPPDNVSDQTSLALPDNTALCAAAPPATSVDPVDGVLRGFRAYYPLWLPGSSKNFDAVAGSTLDATVKAFNPFGRGHGSGCTGCHMLYDNDGKSREPEDPTLAAAGRFPSTGLADRAPADQQGMNVRQEAAGGSARQQRFYPSRHQLTTRIPTRQCGLCHTFVTRIDLALQGISEVEEGDLLARHVDGKAQSGDITFTTPMGTRVRIYDALERVEKTGDKDAAGKDLFKITTDPRVAQQQAMLAAECAKRKIDCDARAIFSADFNDNGELDADEPDLNGGELLLPDRVPREASVDGRQARIVYGGANGSTQLKDVHFQKGMECVDCHFYQDLHGDGNLYTNNWDAVEIECEDCHGFAQKRAFEVTPGRLLTSGANGGNDLLLARDPIGRAFFSVREGDDGKRRLYQRSRVQPDLEWAVPQLADTATMAHGQQHVPSMPKEAGKLECYSCHNAFAMNCLACHYQQNYKKQQREAFLSGGTQPAKTDFQLFGMIRSPLVLGVDGTVENNRIAPFRSSMEAYVSIADCNGNTAFANVVHANCRGGQPAAGTGMNNFMPHTVRTDVVRGCETCHTATNAQGHWVNNHLLAQTYGLGSGRLNYLGDWLLVAGSGDGRDAVLDVVDVKDESEVPGETGAKNSFPGFVVGNRNDASAKLRGFALASTADFAPRDVALLRGFNGSLCSGERALNPDVAVVAAGAGGLQVIDVSTPDARPAGAKIGTAAAVARGNFVAVDVVAPDVSDPIVYAGDLAAGFVIVDLTGLDATRLTTTSSTIGADKLHAAAGWPAGAPALGVKAMGPFAAVAAGPAGLVVVDVSTPTAPAVAGAPLPLCTSTDPLPCARTAARVTVQGAVAYLATSTGLAAVDLRDPRAPALLSVENREPAEDVAISGHLAFLASGAAGLRIVDITDPAQPASLAGQRLLEADGRPLAQPLNQAHGVVIGAVPTQTWAFVADGTNGVRAVNVSTLFDPYRGRAGAPLGAVAPAHAALTLEARDPMAPRDPSVAVDVLPVISFVTRGSARALARGTMLDRIADEGGRRLRDSWNPGNGVLSRAQMDAMRSHTVGVP
jgi:hypothetical protein